MAKKLGNVRCVCRVCGNEFFRCPANIKAGRSKHCSVQCARSSKPNTHVVENGTIYLHLGDGSVCLADMEDSNVVLARRWFSVAGSRSGKLRYATANGRDNRRCNLRFVTHRENTRNLHVKKSSRFPGVRWLPKAGKWSAGAWRRNQYFHVGRFDDEEKAYAAYLNKCKSLDGAGGP